MNGWRVMLCISAWLSTACGARPPVPLEPPDGRSWRSAKDRLAELSREATGGEPRTMQVSVTLHAPHVGSVMEARGAVAVSPKDEALRMMLLGPGGTTALDLWLRGADFRFAVPALDLERRGRTDEPGAYEKGLPVAFLRWWLVRPFRGRLLWTQPHAGGRRFVLRDGPSVVDVVIDGAGRVHAERTTWSAEPEATLVEREVVTASGVGCADVRYRQQSTGLTVAVRCEGISAREPSPDAFEDPDARGGRRDG